MENDYKVVDIDLADFGRKEISLAENEMPALMALRDKYKDEQPLQGAKIMGCIHMTIQTAVLMETLKDLGAELRWSGCNIFSTQDHAAAAMAAAGIPVFAWKGQTDEEFDWCIEQTILEDGKPWDANMILDDGGDLTHMVHTKFPEMLETIHGISEETTTGVHRLKAMLEAHTLKVPAINVNDSVTKSKNDNKYGCRHSLNDGINTGSMECINKELLSTTDLIVTSTGNTNVCDSAMLRSLKAGSVVCNIGHFDNEIDTLYMRDNWKWDEVKPQVHRIYRSENKNDYLILLSEGRLVNLGNATGHPSRIMDGSFANQVLAQMHLFEKKFADLPNDQKAANVTVEILPKKLDEEVAAGMVGGFGGVMTILTDTQAKYINTPKEGPFKSETYKY